MRWLGVSSEVISVPEPEAASDNTDTWVGQGISRLWDGEATSLLSVGGGVRHSKLKS